MQVDIQFNFAKVYAIDYADVAVGQKFKLLTDYDGGKWFSDNDPVLTIKVNGKDSEVSADEIGKATILIMDTTFKVQKTVTINVVEAILDKASTLNASSGEPVNK